MPRLGLLFLIVLCGMPIWAGSPTYIEVLIAAKTMDTPCDTTDVGYVLKEHEDQKKASESVHELARKSYPDANVLTARSNHRGGLPLGTFVVVVNGETTEGLCTKSNFGVGFGADKESALKDAIADLGVRAAVWLQGKKAYKIEFARQLVTSFQTHNIPSSSLAASVMRSRVHAGSQTNSTDALVTPGTARNAVSTVPGKVCATGQPGAVSVIQTLTSPHSVLILTL